MPVAAARARTRFDALDHGSTRVRREFDDGSTFASLTAFSRVFEGAKREEANASVKTGGKTRRKHIEVFGVIDVPGHEKIVHTVAAGACGIDLA
jgi:selenocysteine-specific translation elongation factor